jgi:endo-1,4-beta-xylanase
VVSTEQAFEGLQSLKVTGRTSGWHGTEINLLAIAMPNVAYTYTVSVRYVPTVAADTRIMLSRFVEGTGACPTDGNRWGWIANSLLATDATWTTLTGTYTIPAGCVPTAFVIYVESASATASFYVDAVSMVQQ